MTVRKIRAKLVLQLLAEGLSGRAIAASQGMSRKSIAAVLEAADATETSWDDVALPDKPSARSCNTSFALIFRTVTDCSFRRVPYTRGGRSLEAGGPHRRYCWPPSAIFATPGTGPQRQYRWTPVRRIFTWGQRGHLGQLGQSG